jgi:hypothetical protein
MSGKATPHCTASAWTPTHNRATTLFHGCLRDHATDIINNGVDPSLGQPDTDFGRRFYMTTLRRQAADWAFLKQKALPRASRGALGSLPVVLWIRVPRDELASLQSLAFVRGDYQADEYWSFVQHCRASKRRTAASTAVVQHHHRDPSGVESWYDLVSGPVAAFWQQKSAMLDSDQYSFHTSPAASVLNQILRVGIRGTDYDVEVV